MSKRDTHLDFEQHKIGHLFLWNKAGVFLLFFLTFFVSFTVHAANTSTTIIHYYFNLEDKSGGSEIITDESETDESVEPEDKEYEPCLLPTFTQDPDTGECYCERSESDCLEDEVFNSAQCLCEKCPGSQVVINGVCACAPCSQENYVLDAADCSCSCGLTASDCQSNEYLNDDCECVACALPEDSCEVESGEFDENGCPIYTRTGYPAAVWEGENNVGDTGKTVCCPEGGFFYKGVCCADLEGDLSCVSDSNGNPICSIANPVCRPDSSGACPSGTTNVNGVCVCNLQCESGKQANASCSACVCSTTENCEGNFTWDSESCSCVCNKAGETYGPGMHYDATTCEPVCDAGLVPVSGDSARCANCDHSTNNGCGGGTPYCNIYNTCVECYSHDHCAPGRCVGLTSYDGGGSGKCSYGTCGGVEMSAGQYCCYNPCLGQEIVSSEEACYQMYSNKICCDGNIQEYQEPVYDWDSYCTESFSCPGYCDDGTQSFDCGSFEGSLYGYYYTDECGVTRCDATMGGGCA